MQPTLKEIAKILDNHDFPDDLYAKHLSGKIKKDRPYKTPKNYIKWDLLARIMAISISYFLHPRADVPSKLHALRCALWLSKDAPVYALSHLMLNEFMSLDMSNRKQLLAKFEPVHETFLLLFPQGQVKTPDGKSHIDWIVVHFSDLKKPEKSSLNLSDLNYLGFPSKALSHDDAKNFHISGISNDFYTWYIGAGVDEDGNILESRRSYGSEITSEEEHEFLTKLRDVALQCMLALLYAPELLEDDETSSSSPKQQYKSKSKAKNEFRTVRWIGKTYKRSHQGGHSDKSSKHHKSPRGHLRRGHWHLFPCGKGRKDRICKYVKEVFVEGKNTSSYLGDMK